MKQPHSTHGYYTLSIAAPASNQLLTSNNERAFITSQLQDLLSPRSFMRSIPAGMQVAVCIDLLAYSIRRQAIELVVFTIDTSILDSFGSYIIQELEQYQDSNGIRRQIQPSPRAVISKLRGPHHALAMSAKLHARHEDWEYDRYSSIGFYLHDRRGSWMRTWRLAELYGNKPANYLLVMHAQLNRQNQPHVSVP